MLILMLKLAHEEKPIGYGALPLCHVFASACDTVWGWGNPTLNSLLEGGGGDGEGKMRIGSFLWGNWEIKQVLTS